MTKPAVKTTILFSAMSLACLALHGGAFERKTTPVMGWSSWNSFGHGVNYGNVKAQMDALVRLGLRDLDVPWRGPSCRRAAAGRCEDDQALRDSQVSCPCRVGRRRLPKSPFIIPTDPWDENLVLVVWRVEDGLAAKQFRKMSPASPENMI